MTRTERSTHPRAIIRDRSESKSGLDKRVQKNGGGAHSWGALADDVEWANEMLDDADAALEDNTPKVKRKSSKDAPKMERRMSDEERNEALKLRQGAKVCYLISFKRLGAYGDYDRRTTRSTWGALRVAVWRSAPAPSSALSTCLETSPHP